MNFFDYELSRTASATPPQSAAGSSAAPEPTLNEEVSQVVGQLGRLWGGFRKQVRSLTPKHSISCAMLIYFTIMNAYYRAKMHWNQRART